MQRLLPIFGVVFLDSIAAGLVVPLLPYFAKELGADVSTVGLLGSLFGFAQLIGSPIMGRMGDRYGRKPLLLVSLIASGISYVLLGYASSLALFIVSRLPVGFLKQTGTLSEGLIADIGDATRRAELLGYLGIAMGLGLIIGPPLGGVLSSFYSLHYPAYMAGVVYVVSVIVAELMIPDVRAGGKGKARTGGLEVEPETETEAKTETETETEAKTETETEAKTETETEAKTETETETEAKTSSEAGAQSGRSLSAARRKLRHSGFVPQLEEGDVADFEGEEVEARLTRAGTPLMRQARPRLRRPTCEGTAEAAAVPGSGLGSIASRFVAFLREGELWVLCLSRLGNVLASAVFMKALPHITAIRFGFTARENGLLMGYMGLIHALVQGVAIRPLTRRFCDCTLLTYGMAVMGVSLVAVSYAGTWIVMLIALAPLGLAGGLLNTVLTSSLSRRVAPENLGGMLGISGSVTSLSRALAPWIGGLLVQNVSDAAPGVFGAVLCGVVAFFIKCSVTGDPAEPAIPERDRDRDAIEAKAKTA